VGFYAKSKVATGHSAHSLHQTKSNLLGLADTMRVTSISVAMLSVATALAQTPDTRQNVHGYLTRHGFDEAALSNLEGGAVVARADVGQSNDREILVVAAVKIRVPRPQVTSYYGQMISYVDGQVTQAFGRFSSPPAIADVNTLAFDRNEVDQLKSCRPGDCDIRLGGAGLEALRTSIDWSAADYVERVNAFARKAAVDYVTAYQASGDAALVTYNDRAEPVRLREQWRGILANSTLFHDYSPELRAYLEQYPKATLPGAKNIFYWAKESFGVGAPIVSLVHGIVYEPPSRRDRTIVVQKQLYASHYFDGSLAIGTLLDTQEAGRPATYLVYANRSRGDLLKGGLGGLKRNVASVQARRGAEETLGTIQRIQESQ
jgi:hypothetical protein